jgi:hypothetical protein
MHSAANAQAAYGLIYCWYNCKFISRHGGIRPAVNGGGDGAPTTLNGTADPMAQIQPGFPTGQAVTGLLFLSELVLGPVKVVA